MQINQHCGIPKTCAKYKQKPSGKLTSGQGQHLVNQRIPTITAKTIPFMTQSTDHVHLRAYGSS